MLRIFIVLSVLGLFSYQTCRGDTILEDDWRKQGFYRPRRNFPSQTQNGNSFQTGKNLKPDRESSTVTYSQNSISSFGVNNDYNTQKQNAFGLNTQQQNSFGFNAQPSFGSRSQIKETSRTGTSHQRVNSFGANQNSQGQSRDYGYSQSKYSFGGSNQNPGFPGSGFNQQTTYSFESNQNSQRQSINAENSGRNAFGFIGQKTFQSDYSQTTGQETFGSRVSKSSFSGSPNLNLQAPDGQNPFRSTFDQSSSQSTVGNYNHNTPSFSLNSQVAFGSFGQRVQNQNPSGSFQNQNSFSSFGTFGFGKNQNYQAHDYLPPKPFKAPGYLPPDDSKTTSTTRRPFYTTTTTRRPISTTTFRPFYTTTTRRPFYTTTTTKRPFITTTRRFFTTTIRPTTGDDNFPDTITRRPINAVAPAMAIPVPPEPDDDGDNNFPDTITKRPVGAVLPAMAMPVPPEPDDDGDEIFPGTLTTRASTPSTTSSTTPTTTQSTTTTTTVRTTPSTITTPTTLSTTSTTIRSTTPDLNRNFIETEPTTIKTTTKAPSTTVVPVITAKVSVPITTTTPKTPFVGIGYLPPAPNTTTTTQKPDGQVDPVPKKPKCNPLDPRTWPTEYEQQRFGDLPCALVTSIITTNSPSVLPARADEVPPEPECDPLDPSTWPSEVDQREFGESPCAPITTESSTTMSTTPSTTTTLSTTPSTTTTISTTPSTTTTLSTTPSTTTTVSTTPSTTTTLSTTPSTTTTTTTTTTPKTTTASTTTTTTTTTPKTTTTSTTTTTEKPYVGLRYLPPPNITTTMEPFTGYDYHPPECFPTKRRRRASTETLRLADLEGTPRPVWYAGIYRKTSEPYMAICGGSIIREDVVISAAHCFWNDVVGLQSPDIFAVATSKIYKPWNEAMDKKAQKSDVLDIKIPPRFLGAKTSFQEDIAILKLATPFRYTRGVKPICVDFDDDFDRQQMKAGHYGTVAGWGLTDSKGTPSQRLLWLELPYIEIDKCIRDSEDAFLKYITCDKVCAGENDTGKALCRGDSGGGLVFWAGPASRATPYLRGVASTAPSPRNAECNVYAYGSFTHVRAHRTFLREHVPGVEECRFWE